MEKYNVKESVILYEFLRNIFKKLSKNNVKSLLHNEKVYVNNKLVTQYNYQLKKNDIVEIKNKISNNIEIIYEDKDIIVINKPSGLLTISTEKEKSKTAYHLVMEYLKIKNKNNKIFVIHRLDRDTSGIIMFAKNEKTKHLYQDNWNDIIKKRCYYAIVDGKMNNNIGEIKSYLKEKNNMVFSTSNKDGKLAITEYKVLKEKNTISLLDINIKTGRKNQIRVHMKENKTPILGDLKYGEKSKLIKRMALHAYKLELINPITKKIITYEVNMPNEFKKLFN